jgi:hypothetical protein
MIMIDGGFYTGICQQESGGLTNTKLVVQATNKT